MAMSYTIDFDDQGAVTVRTHGTADRHGIVRFIDELVDDPRFQAGTTVLIDHTNLDLHPLHTADIQAIADAVIRMNDRVAGTAVAIVTPASVGYGLSRQFTAFAESFGSGLDTRVFTTLEEARRWLAKRRTESRR